MSTTQDRDNPYAPPKAAVLEPATQVGTLVPDGQKVAAGRGVAWYGEAWKLFTAAPGMWVLLFVIFIVVTVVVGIVPFLGSLITSLCYPVIAAGLMLGCRSIEEGHGLTVGHLFAGFGKNVGSLLLVGLLYLVGMVLIGLFIGIAVGVMIPAMGIKVGQASSITAVLAMAPLFLVAVLAGLALTLPLIMAIWFAPALVVFHDLGPMEAMKSSFQGALKNIVPFLLYGILGLVLVILAVIPFGLGLLVWVPVLWASIYTAYRDIFLRPA